MSLVITNGSSLKNHSQVSYVFKQLLSIYVGKDLSELGSKATHLPHCLTRKECFMISRLIENIQSNYQFLQNFNNDHATITVSDLEQIKSYIEDSI